MRFHSLSSSSFTKPFAMGTPSQASSFNKPKVDAFSPSTPRVNAQRQGATTVQHLTDILGRIDIPIKTFKNHEDIPLRLRGAKHLIEIALWTHDMVLKDVKLTPEQSEEACANAVENALTRLDLSGVDLSELDLRGVNLAHGRFKKTNFTNTLLDNANLTVTHWEGANLTGTSLDGVDLAGANLKDTDLSKVKALHTRVLLYAMRNKQTVLPKYLDLSQITH